ncbi:MAG: hypothetical protein CFE21_02660 [Bacteroidetes bacterium B1(2017)]|nr:MAG: hypothetical protein CFE21_02660 [Bacteroidetes bacterium B1(2017)]
MLVSFALLVYAYVITYCVGAFAWALLKKFFAIEIEGDLNPAILPIIGISFISVVIAIYHFFFPIDWVVHVFFIAFIFSKPSTLVFLLKSIGSNLKENWLIFGVLLLGAILSIVSRPGSGDIADYHLQAIKWAENYPNIPGLGNFNRPLANNNWWFNFQSFIGFSWLGVKSVYVGNALFFFVAFSWFYFSRVLSKAHQWMRLLFGTFIILSFKTAFIGAVTPDFEVTLTIYLLLDLFIFWWFEPKNRAAYFLLIVLICCWILTVKATAISFGMLALPGLWEYLKNKQFKTPIKVIGLASIFILPWLIGNVIISGYLLYPFHQINLFHFDWKIPEYMLKWETFSIKNWGKISGQDVYITSQLRMQEWLPIWFLKLDLLNRLLILLFVLSTPILWVFGLKRKELIWPIIFIQSGFLLLFLNGPHPRFLFGYMVSSIAMVLYLMAPLIKFEIPKLALIYLAGLFAFYLGFKTVQSGNLQAGMIHPISYPQNHLPTIQLGSIKPIVTTIGGSCWDQFPCTYYLIDSVGMRTQNIEDGFRVKE